MRLDNAAIDKSHVSNAVKADGESDIEAFSHYFYHPKDVRFPARNDICTQWQPASRASAYTDCAAADFEF